MKRLFVYALAAVTFIFASGSDLFAQPGPGMRQGHPFFKRGMKMKEQMGKVMKELNLTDKQKEEIKALKLDNKKKAVDLKASLEKIQIAKHEMISSGKVDKDKFLKSVEQANKIKGELAYNEAVVKMKVYDLLDDNQKKVWLKYAEKMMAMKGAMKDRIQKRFGR